MSIMIVGGGSLGSFLAGLMEEKKEKVIIIEREDLKVEKLKKDLKNSIIIHGNGCNLDVLKKLVFLKLKLLLLALEMMKTIL